jgi:hypothetical protein
VEATAGIEPAYTVLQGSGGDQMNIAVKAGAEYARTIPLISIVVV